MITINYRDPRPVYEQIRDGYIREILSGEMPADTKLPSVRELAVELAINPNTIQRAYRELEAGGYVYSMAGRGSFVAAREGSVVDDAKTQALLAQFEKLVAELKYLGCTDDDLCARVKGGEK